MISVHCASTDMCAAATLLMRLGSACHSVAQSRLEREGMRIRHPAAASLPLPSAGHLTLDLLFAEHSSMHGAYAGLCWKLRR